MRPYPLETEGERKETYRFLPVPEPVRVIAWIAAHHRDERLHHQSHHEKGLENRHIEFGHSKIPDGQAVEDADFVSWARIGR